MILFALTAVAGNFPATYPRIFAELQPIASKVGIEQNWRVFLGRFTTVYAVRLDIAYADGTFASDVVRAPRITFTRSGNNRQTEYLAFENQPHVLGAYLEAVCKEKGGQKKVVSVTMLRAPLSVGHIDDANPEPVNTVSYQPHFYHICEGS
jgi:hypothetical protein